MSLKYVALLAVASAAIWGVAGHETSAQDCTGRTVPVTVCNPTQVCPVLAPSRMVAASMTGESGNPEQILIPLETGKVFVLTSWSVAGGGMGETYIYLFEGSAFTNTAVRDVVRSCTENWNVQHRLPTGIRFPRDPNGNADIYLKRSNESYSMHAVVQGYIADDN